MRRLRYVLWALVAVAAIGSGVLLLRGGTPHPTVTSTPSQVSFGGPFTLVGSDGKPFSRQRLAGRPHVMFFGFTHCPDVCPTTLARMVRLRRQLGKGSDAFDIVFVSVDPDRDGPQEVGKYAELFGEPVIGLTGSPAQIDQVKKQFGIFSAKSPDESGGYSVDHTSTVLLFDRDGKFDSTISPEEGNGPALDKLRRITA